MMAEYLVIKRETCAVCQGFGNVMHPLWEELCKEMGAPLSEEQIKKWFRSKGYDQPPPEEEECKACGGKGFIESKVPLLEALKDLGVLK